jgi:hypothetical protein
MLEETRNRKQIPMNLQFFGEEEEPKPEPTAEPTPEPEPPKQPEKTFTQAELNAREASARKAAEDKARKDILKSLGVDTLDETTLELFKTARKNSDEQKSLAEKYEALSKAHTEKDAEIAKMAAKLTAMEQINTLIGLGVTAKQAKVLRAGIAEMVTETLDFEAAAKEYLEENKSKDEPKKPHVLPPGPGNPQPPSDDAEAKAFQEMYDAAKKINDGIAMTQLLIGAQRKGIIIKP